MLAWMRSFGELQRIGIESTGSYGAGLLRFRQQAKVTVLEVTTPDKQDRRRRGKNDDLDAQNAAHAAFAGQRTVTPRSRDGMIESLRVLMACRKTAVSARRIALQMIHNTIVCAPDDLRDQLRSLTRMQLVRTLASWRPDLTAYRDLDSAYRIGLKSLARRYLELHDEIADLDAMIAAIVDELAPNLVARNSIGHTGAAQLRPATIRKDCARRPASHRYAAPAQFRRRREGPSGIGLIVEENAQPIARCTSSLSVACEPTRGPRTTSLADSPKGIPSSMPFEP
jgi:transposase